MFEPLIRTIVVNGSDVRVGDVVSMGGIPQRVRELRELMPSRKKLIFEDGNAYILGKFLTIEVTRLHAPLRRVR
ncbi:hypothetical protein ACWC9S_06220 [Streptomyces xiamenensis]